MQVNSVLFKLPKLQWSWALPMLALAFAAFMHYHYPIRFQNESVGLKFAFFNLLIPSIALWLLNARLTEPRVLLWASSFGILLTLPTIPLFSIYIVLFNRDNRKIRIVGQCLLALLALAANLMFVFAVFWNSGALYHGQSQIKILERAKLGDFEIVISSLDNMGALGGYQYNVYAVKPLGRWFKIVHPIASRYRSGFSELKVIGPHTFTVKVHSPDGGEATVETVDCKF